MQATAARLGAGTFGADMELERMTVMDVRPSADCSYDVVALGEVMLRFDPGEGRIRTARTFRVSEGGGEYNVARGLRRCFGLSAAVVTALVDNEIGRLVEDLLLQGGVDTALVRWAAPTDGAGRGARNGLNFTERGFGLRGAVGVSDRGHTATSQLRPGEINWDDLFGRRGVRWLHTGGIFAGLSASTAEVAEEAMLAAHRHGTVVSYDLNFRPSLWPGPGGRDRAQAVNKRLARYVDVLVGNEEDFTAALGFPVSQATESLHELDADTFARMIDQVAATYPNLHAVATSLRTVHTANVNDWGAIGWSEGTFARATQRDRVEVLDRVGGGDSFMSGLVYGLLTSGDLATALEYGAAHGVLAMTTPGDTSMATLREVEALMAGGGARIAR